MNRTLQRISRSLQAAVVRAREARKVLTKLINQAKAILVSHGVRITQNEEDIEAGRTAIQNLAARVTNLEGGV